MHPIDKAEFRKVVGEGIRLAREKKFPKRRDMCQVIDKGESTIAHIELGNQLPRLDHIIQIALACECSLDELCAEAIAMIKNGEVKPKKKKKAKA